MADLSGFDASKVDPTDFGTIPPGDYEACIVNSEMKATKDGNGSYLNLEVQIINGQFQNRRIFDKLNLQNRNEQAVTIAKGTLSAICRAVNVLTPNDSSELHNKPMRISVGSRKNDYRNGETENYIKSYKPRSAGTVAQPLMTGQQQPQYATTEAKKPWAS